MRIFQSHPALRWLAPVAAVAVIGGSSLVATTALAGPALPEIGAEQLLVKVQQARLTDLSGEVVQTSDLGLPELPGLGGGSDGDLTSLLTGTHTLRVWLAGQDKHRVAVFGTFGEYDVMRNGRDVWTWSSEKNLATHQRLAADAPDTKGDAKTPQEIAAEILDAIGDSTAVDTTRTDIVAGREAYELVLTPKQGGSLLTRVQIAVDGETYTPLRVQVFAADATPVFEVGFQQVEFSAPGDEYFTFVAPPSTTVKELPTPTRQGSDDPKGPNGSDGSPTIVGDGWARIAVTTLETPPTEATGKDAEQLQRILAALPKVTGDWGSGRLLAGKAFSVVIADDGRVAAGAVAPALLYAALDK